MNSSRGDYARQIDWSAVKGNAAQQCQNEILRRLFTIEKAQTAQGVAKWLRGTPFDFICDQLEELVNIGMVERRSGGYVIRDQEQYSSWYLCQVGQSRFPSPH